MRQTGVIGIFRLVLLTIGFVLFVLVSVQSAHNMASPGAIGTHRFAQTFSTSQLGKLISNGALVTSLDYRSTTPNGSNVGVSNHHVTLVSKSSHDNRVATELSGKKAPEATGHKTILTSTSSLSHHKDNQPE